MSPAGCGLCHYVDGPGFAHPVTGYCRSVLADQWGWAVPRQPAFSLELAVIAILPEGMRMVATGMGK
jgi:hypothetical protein